MLLICRGQAKTATSLEKFVLAPTQHNTTEIKQKVLVDIEVTQQSEAD